MEISSRCGNKRAHASADSAASSRFCRGSGTTGIEETQTSKAPQLTQKTGKSGRTIHVGLRSVARSPKDHCIHGDDYPASIIVPRHAMTGSAHTVPLAGHAAPAREHRPAHGSLADCRIHNDATQTPAALHLDIFIRSVRRTSGESGKNRRPAIPAWLSAADTVIDNDCLCN